MLKAKKNNNYKNPQDGAKKVDKTNINRFFLRQNS